MRVPLLLRWPGQVRAGSRSDQVMISMDFMPTLLAAAGLAPDPAFPSDGMNLLPVLLGRQSPVPRSLYWRFKANQQSAHRDGNWKYLKLGGKEHLFDVVRDPRERADRKDAEPAVFARLKAEFNAWDATMLPYLPETFSEDVKLHYPDRY
jgi:arylsulfatase A-like enzyme